MVNRSPLRVLVVDDEPQHRAICRAALEREPDLAYVGEAFHGRRAVELAGSLRPDVVVLDLHMPIMDGFAALPLLRSIVPRAAIVVWSNEGSLQLERAKEAGACDVVRKLAPVEVLVAAIRGCAGKRDSDLVPFDAIRT